MPNLRDTEAWQRQIEEEKLAALAEFAAGAGHEINNPLAVICGRAELLLRQETHPERRRDLATIHAQAKRVYEMIADLMLFARPPPPALAPVELAGLLQELAGELRPRCRERGIELRMDLESEPVEVLADRTQLLVALRAVCDNALEAVGPEGRVEIEARSGEARIGEGKSRRFARMKVRDSGPGIEDEVRRHLFDPFFSGRGAGRGLGTGLAKCWRIVQMHDGSIDVASERGKGTTFSITLPAHAPPSPAKRGAHRRNGSAGPG